MNTNSKVILGIVVAIVIVIVGSMLMNKPDNRALNERVGDAISNMDPRELKDRTPAERMSDAVQDAVQ